VKINRVGPLSITEEKELFFVSLQDEAEIKNCPLKLEVGIRGQLHIEFEFSKSRLFGFYLNELFQ
jgi:hypothetical protein